jgi:hypothetical protein
VRERPTTLVLAMTAFLMIAATGIGVGVPMLTYPQSMDVQAARWTPYATTTATPTPTSSTLPTATVAVETAATATPAPTLLVPSSTNAASPSPTPAGVATQTLALPSATVVASPTEGSQPVPSPTPKATLEPVMARAPEDAVRLRSGPGTGFDTVGVLRAGESLTVTARSMDWAWWQVCCVSQQPAWVASQYISVTGPTLVLPVIEAAALPTLPAAEATGTPAP